MTRAVCFGLMLLLCACASTEQAAPLAVDWPNGCFELPVGKSPDGSAPMACTTTNGLNAGQQNDEKTDDEEDTRSAAHA